MTITYYRDANGKMPPSIAAEVQKALSVISHEMAVSLTVTPAPPFANMDASERIACIVEWYNGLAMDFCDLDTLANYSRLLSCANADLGAIIGLLRKDTVQSEYRRKRHFAERVTQIKASQGCSGAEAERVAEAEPEYQALRESEARAKGDDDAAGFILRTSGEVLDNMRQQIAILRREKEDEKFGRGSQT